MLKHFNQRVNDLHKLSLIKSDTNLFVKRELVPNSNFLFDKNKPPRPISGVNNETNVLLNPWIETVSKYFSTIFDRYHPNFYYVSGSTVDEVGDWFYRNKFKYPYWYEDDFSMFDSTVSKLALREEFKIYDLFGPTDRIKELLNRQFITKGYTNYGDSYKVNGTRKSGDPNTSIGNSLLNILVHSYALQKQGIPLSDFKLMVLGDDMVLLSKVRVDIDKATNLIKGLGFNPKFKYTNKESELEFCSSNFVPTVNSNILVTKFGRFLTKLSVAITKGNLIDPLPHNHAVAIGYRYLWDHPLYGNVLLRLYAQSKHTVPSKYDDYWLLNVPTMNPDFKTDLLSDFYYSRYGYTVDQIVKSLNGVLEGVYVPADVVFSDVLQDIILKDNN
jgi:hypothetical protein